MGIAPRAKTLRLLPPMLLALAASAKADTLPVALFSAGDLSGWESHSFRDETRYDIVQLDGTKVLRAESNASASGLVKKLRVNLRHTPFLNWRWKVDGVLDGVDEQAKIGDDFAARIYLIVSGGLLFWRTFAMNYVWSNQQSVSSAWPNPFTDNAMMIAVRSGADQAGRWVSEKRDVRQDFRRVFGREVETIDAVALMTDTDNSGGHARAYYGDIFFSSD